MRCSCNINTWLDYIDNKLATADMQKLEDHLLQCDHCVQLYEEALQLELSSEWDNDLEIPDLTPKIVAELEQHPPFLHLKTPKLQHKYSQKTNNRQMFIHYAIAASIALILFRIGLFDQFIVLSTQTQQVPEHTTQFLDTLYKQPMEWFKHLNFLPERSQS